MINPIFSLVFQLVKGLGLQTLQDFRICSFHLSVASWVGPRGETHPDAHFFAEFEESSTCELSAIVRYDSVWYSKAIDDPFDELDGGLGHLAWYWHHLHPLCELVNCYEEVFMSSDRFWHLAHDIQPPDREWPGDWYGLQSLQEIW